MDEFIVFFLAFKRDCFILPGDFVKPDISLIYL